MTKLDQLLISSQEDKDFGRIPFLIATAYFLIQRMNGTQISYIFGSALFFI